MSKINKVHAAKSTTAKIVGHVEKDGRQWWTLPISTDADGSALAVRPPVPLAKILGDEPKAVQYRRNRYEAFTNLTGAGIAKVLSAIGYDAVGYADDRAGSRIASHVVGIHADGHAIVIDLRGKANADDGTKYGAVNTLKVYRVNLTDEVVRKATLPLTNAAGAPTFSLENGEIPAIATDLARTAARVAGVSDGQGKTVGGALAGRVLTAARRVGSITG